MRVWLQIQESRVRSRHGPILSWRLIMNSFLQSFFSLMLNHSRRVVVSYKRKYMHKVLVKRLFKLAQAKNVDRWTGRPAMNIAVYWNVKQPTHQPTTNLLGNNKMIKMNLKFSLYTYLYVPREIVLSYRGYPGRLTREIVSVRLCSVSSSVFLHFLL